MELGLEMMPNQVVVFILNAICSKNLLFHIFCVAKGLQHLRTHNFIHRDIKPGNIMRCQKVDGR